MVGEYSYLSELGADEMLTQLCKLMDGIYEDAATKCWIVSALLKVTAQAGSVKPNVAAMLNKYKDSMDMSLQLRCYEAMTLVQLPPQALAQLLPRDSAVEASPATQPSRRRDAASLTFGDARYDDDDDDDYHGALPSTHPHPQTPL